MESGKTITETVNSFVEQVDPKVIDSFIRLLTDSIAESKEFVLEQAPLVLQELVAYGRVLHLAHMIAALLICIIIFFLAAQPKRLYLKHKGEDREVIMIFGVLPRIFALIASGFISIGSISQHLSPCLMSWFAPRVYILTYLHDILK